MLFTALYTHLGDKIADECELASCQGFEADREKGRGQLYSNVVFCDSKVEAIA